MINLTSKRWKMICLQDVFKALLYLFVISTHLSFVFYYFWVHDEPNLLALFAFIALAIYIHAFIFLSLLAITNSVISLALRYGIKNGIFRLFVSHIFLFRLFTIFVSVGFVIAGFIATSLPPVIRNVTVPIKNLPHSQEGLNIILLTDLHIGPTVGRSNIQRTVNITNSLNADIIAISGDLIDGSLKNLENAAFPLKELRSKYGTYFVTGNHEYIHGNITEWLYYLSSLSIKTLRNEHVALNIGNSVLCLAGVDDLFAERSQSIPGHKMNFNKALNCNANSTVVMLAHQPNAAKVILNEKAKTQRIDLILSGHTHGGQLYLLVPLIYILNSYARGLYYHDMSSAYLYVSAGVNYFGPPVKIFGGCEIISIKLHRSK
ncbi:unnamed protein product [Dracunculus medinensis]|uniref:Metallophos domain-containing protein n=1 Tax=Dracunculus medinensis TaxID=318479 RepID=A0A0N4U2J6_DRAME|nr:unnamed protein product [Dracunculus medinensis]